jgi:hypothetical protein
VTGSEIAAGNKSADNFELKSIEQNDGRLFVGQAALMSQAITKERQSC